MDTTEQAPLTMGWMTDLCLLTSVNGHGAMVELINVHWPCFPASLVSLELEETVSLVCSEV